MSPTSGSYQISSACVYSKHVLQEASYADMTKQKWRMHVINRVYCPRGTATTGAGAFEKPRCNQWNDHKNNFFPL